MIRAKLYFKNSYSVAIEPDVERVKFRKRGALIELTFEEMDQVAEFYGLVQANPLKFEDEKGDE